MITLYIDSPNSYYSTYSLFNTKPFGAAGLSTYYPTLNQDWVHRIQNNFSAIAQLLTGKLEKLERSSDKFSKWSPNNAFNAKTVLSSDSEIAECIFFSDSAKNKLYQIEVLNMAVGQVNTGAYILATHSDPDHPVSDLSSGKIRIINEKRSFDLNIDIAEDSTNEEALKEIRNTLNAFSSKNNLGLSANILQDKPNVALQIREQNTGRKFSFEDITGNIVGVTKIDHVDIPAENANFIINNVRKSSQENRVTFEAGKIAFKLKSVGQVSAHVVVDSSSVVNAAIDLTKDYNNLQSYLADNPDKLRVNSLMNKLRNIFRNKTSASLEDIGVYINSNHNILVDGATLKSALENNSDNVRNMLSGISGVFGKINQAVKAAMAVAPTAYVDIAKVYTDVLWEKNKSFKMLFNSFVYNFMGSKAPYSNYLSKGNLMDFYF